jgi:hypothetical protein
VTGLRRFVRQPILSRPSMGVSDSVAKEQSINKELKI